MNELEKEFLTKLKDLMIVYEILIMKSKNDDGKDIFTFCNDVALRENEIYLDFEEDVIKFISN